MRVCTIGHSRSALEELLQAIVQAGVRTVVDVRSHPKSKMDHFDQVPLKRALERAGLEYRFMGNLLGGIPRDQHMRKRWRQGQLDPQILANLRASSQWKEGISELSRLLRSYGGDVICILCSERNPSHCHRKAVALDLADAVPGTEIVHLTVTGPGPSEVGVQEALM